MESSIGRLGCVLFCLLLLGTTLAAAEGGPVTVGGSVRTLVIKSRTVAVDQAGKSTLIIRFNDQTSFQNVPSAKDILPGENVSIEYRREGDDNLAARITKVIPKLPAGVGEMTVKELEGLISTGNADGRYLLVDARPASKYAAGHIPTAVSIPLPTLEKQGAGLLPSRKEIPLVFYCGGVTCGMSHKSAQIARSLGYSDVKVYTGGEPGWKKAEHYTVPSSSFLKDGNIVLVDLREPKASEAGHIPGAVNIQLSRMEGSESRFPSSKGAQLVFYGDKESDVNAAVSTARDWGFTNVTGFPGGTKEWQRSGFELKKGAPSDRIVYKKRLGPNEMDPAEFLKGLGEGNLLVDVRTSEEYAKERISNSINIPTEQMAKRFTELPKGKQVVFYCNTGVRAEMAFDVVKGKGYAVKFLNASVDFKKDGSYIVSE